jgi:hypothetical protein
LAYSFASDFLYIAATRWMLSLVTRTEGTFKNILILTANTLLGVLLFAYPILLGVFLIWQLNFQAMGIGLAGASTLNFIDLITCSVFFILAIIMIVHRLFWPIIERPLYSIQRYAIEKKAWLWGVGGALLLHPPGLAGLFKWVFVKTMEGH